MQRCGGSLAKNPGKESWQRILAKNPGKEAIAIHTEKIRIGFRLGGLHK
jgi:hypothetical protein